jgi:ABC-type multidrug transport system fused ATPase/permease subunit
MLFIDTCENIIQKTKTIIIHIAHKLSSRFDADKSLIVYAFYFFWENK